MPDYMYCNSLLKYIDHFGSTNKGEQYLKKKSKVFLLVGSIDCVVRSHLKNDLFLEFEDIVERTGIPGVSQR